MISDGKPILDACCGSRMFWFDKDNPFVEFMDIRDEEVYLSDGQLCIVHPNTIGDFTAMPFPDSSFKMVVFDPPHLVWAGKAANLYKRFGCLNKDWKEELTMGFNECFRVLEPYGVLIFKWCETQLKLKTVLALTREKPLFGHKRGKTFWVAFMKIPNTPPPWVITGNSPFLCFLLVRVACKRYPLFVEKIMQKNALFAKKITKKLAYIIDY